MPHFRYRAVTHAGEVVIGEVEAPSRDEVVKRIEYLGHLAIGAEVFGSSVLGRGAPIRRKPPRPRDVPIFLRQLAVFVGAGLALDAALQTLRDGTSKALAWLAGSLPTSISAGESFAEAL